MCPLSLLQINIKHFGKHRIFYIFRIVLEYTFCIKVPPAAISRTFDFSMVLFYRIKFHSKTWSDLFPFISILCTMIFFVTNTKIAPHPQSVALFCNIFWRVAKHLFVISSFVEYSIIKIIEYTNYLPLLVFFYILTIPAIFALIRCNALSMDFGLFPKSFAIV